MEWCDATEVELWGRWKSAADLGARDRLLMRYSPWAASVARRVHRKVWAAMADCDDFEQNARIGLIEAISRFDPDRGIPFLSYATPRVRGAVFNGLRAILGDRPPALDEGRHAARLETLQHGGSGDAFESVVDAIVGLGLGYLLDDAARHAAATEDGLAYATTSQRSARLEAAISRLPDRLRAIIESHYFRFVPFHELASAAGITKGRMSQLHHDALTRLRLALRDLE